jgi:EAL domain-containing protein (putative c-di-GMP-specific phosphodiesterase class I)
VNIPTRSLLDVTFPKIVQSMLTTVGVAADLLRLEVTESGVMTNPHRSIRVLNGLRALGVHLSIDDYGTGYTSMTYLRDLPVDELKIDRSFVTHMDDDAVSATLATAIVQLGHNLGMSVVAEGVESAVVGEALRGAGCDGAQGFYYARPMPAEAMTRWVTSHDLPVRTPA